MPRKSAAALSVFPSVDGRPSRLKPRPDASPHIRQIFRDLVAAVPPEHFRPGDADLIEQHAQAIALARQAYGEIEQHGPVVDGRASPWCTVLEKAHRSCVALSGRLRLSPQGRLDPKTVGRQRPEPGRRPWEESR